MSIGASSIKDNRQVVMTLDHDVQNKTEKNLKKYKLIEEFAKQNGVDFYPAGRGIGHQIMVEEGYAFPNQLSVASDSHTNMYGGIGCLGTPIVRTDAASIWATGRTWWQVPPVARVEFTGKLRPGVSGKDVIVTLCGVFNQDQVLNHAIEFVGDGISSIPIDDRLTIANMTTEWGALSGLFPVDDKLIAWLRSRADFLSQKLGGGEHPRVNHERIDQLEADVLTPHPYAKYAKHITLNLSTVSPYISGPNSVKVSNSLNSIESQNIAIQKAYLVSCTNSRLSDLKAAADVIKGKKVADGVEFYIAAASSEVQKLSESQGDWQTLLDAGARPLPAGCGPCIGLGIGLLEDGEVGISATNRNFKGRMGSPNALAYLASPAVVAASAVEGKIVGPKHVVNVPIESSMLEYEHDDTKPVSSLVSELNILEGFPQFIEGEILFCDQDNMTTDGIYPGKYTYQDDITPEKMAEVCMENYDPSFGEKSQPGDILVGGWNFGTGSSREQAATAILARQIPLVVCGSFGDIFKRNSINNALLCVEAPKLLNRLRETFAVVSKDNGEEERVLTRRTGWKLHYDLGKSQLTVTESDGSEWTVGVGEVGGAVQEIFVKGGLEGWVKSKL